MANADFQSIDIDFDVFKELTVRRLSAAVSYNDVLRDLLKLGPSARNPGAAPTANGEPWITKGVAFPHGTEFRAVYKGKTHFGRVEDGKLQFNGKAYTSLSPAAIEITDNATNGWVFWECRLPGQSGWRLADHYRKK